MPRRHAAGPATAQQWVAGRLLAAGGMVLLAALPACSSAEDEPGQDYCDALVAYQDEAAAFGDLVAEGPSIAELVEQQQALRDAAADVLAVRDDVDAAIVDAVEQARGDFAAAISAIPGDATLSETQDIYRDAARDYLASIGEVVQDQGCR